MSDAFAPRIGGVLSADIAVPEHERVVRFYAAVLGTGAKPLWREDLMNNRGVPIIGLGSRSTEHVDLPIQWMPHMQVADVAASVDRALALGGAELMHAKDGEGRSQWAVLGDPDRAAFGIIPVVSAEESPSDARAVSRDAASSEGRICWLDLTVANATMARDFYRQVVGWSTEDVEMDDAGGLYADYNMIGDDGNPVAGICHARGVNLGLPAAWLIYLPVGDLAESLEQVQKEGGKIIRAVPGINGKYESAVIQDPVGAHLALVPGSF